MKSRTITWHTTMELDSDVETDCAVEAVLSGRYQPAHFDKGDGQWLPPEYPEVDLISVRTEYGDEVLHLLRPHEVGRLENEAMSVACEEVEP